MIAANYRKFPEAMALQLVLVFGRPVWNTTRPSTRIGRALRQGQAAIVKATPQLVRWVKTATPQWFRDQVKRAKALAAQVLAALDSLVWDLAEVSGAAEPESTSAKVARLVEDYLDDHHGNMPRPFFFLSCWRTYSRWYHIPSGTYLKHLEGLYTASKYRYRQD